MVCLCACVFGVAGRLVSGLVYVLFGVSFTCMFSMRVCIGL